VQAKRFWAKANAPTTAQANAPTTAQANAPTSAQANAPTTAQANTQARANSWAGTMQGQGCPVHNEVADQVYKEEGAAAVPVDLWRLWRQWTNSQPLTSRLMQGQEQQVRYEVEGQVHQEEGEEQLSKDVRVVLKQAELSRGCVPSVNFLTAKVAPRFEDGRTSNSEPCLAHKQPQ